MLLAAWNTFQIPIDVAFEPAIFAKRIFFYLNSFVDVIFFIDILVNFRSAYIDTKTGEEVREGWMVAYNYLHTRFLIDFLATVPFDLMASFFFDSNSLFFQLFGLLKLIRVLRLARIVTFLNLQDDTVVIFSIGTLIFFLIVYLHCYTCFWFFIVNSKKEWLPPADYDHTITGIYSEGWVY